MVETKFIHKLENISYHVAAGKINKKLLHKIMTSIFNGDYDHNDELALEIYNAIKD
ncbi:hypothetical protein IMX26_05960 [Clostridium sp. 'deep sea']|uniref:hypothetical protein n=1 Tax=Clostridium sp. 'deep sea' TaxID=2779445 RepID=UPI0018967C42|nr:hypothetical protein [Clostridium sp. 'deep sea']QOR36356.1 hypothetical protein IMX26_05960 [Clostridium sp. 'deep sea']